MYKGNIKAKEPQDMMFLWLFLFKFFIKNGKGVVIFTVNFSETTLESAAEKITALFFCSKADFKEISLQKHNFYSVRFTHWLLILHKKMGVSYGRISNRNVR